MKKKGSSALWLTLFAVIVLVGVVGIASLNKRTPTELDGFAQCLTDQGVKLYSASWCPNCANQKAMFGNAIRFIDEKECSTAQGRDLALCQADNVTSVPTWEFADGSRLTGTQNLETLSERTGCPLTGEPFSDVEKEGVSSTEDGSSTVNIDLGDVSIGSDGAIIIDGEVQTKTE